MSILGIRHDTPRPLPLFSPLPSPHLTPQHSRFHIIDDGFLARLGSDDINADLRPRVEVDSMAILCSAHCCRGGRSVGREEDRWVGRRGSADRLKPSLPRANQTLGCVPLHKFSQGLPPLAAELDRFTDDEEQFADALEKLEQSLCPLPG